MPVIGATALRRAFFAAVYLTVATILAGCASAAGYIKTRDEGTLNLSAFLRSAALASDRRGCFVHVSFANGRSARLAIDSSVCADAKTRLQIESAVRGEQAAQPLPQHPAPAPQAPPQSPE